jgi:hypothetical protein
MARHLRISGSMEQNPFLKLTTDQLLKKLSTFPGIKRFTIFFA